MAKHCGGFCCCNFKGRAFDGPTVWPSYRHNILPFAGPARRQLHVSRPKKAAAAAEGSTTQTRSRSRLHGLRKFNKDTSTKKTVVRPNRLERSLKRNNVQKCQTPRWKGRGKAKTKPLVCQLQKMAFDRSKLRVLVLYVHGKHRCFSLAFFKALIEAFFTC